MTHWQDLLESTSQELVAQVYPKVQVVGGGDQRIDQLHAGNLRRRRAEVSEIKNTEDVSLAEKNKTNPPTRKLLFHRKKVTVLL